MINNGTSYTQDRKTSVAPGRIYVNQPNMQLSRERERVNAVMSGNLVNTSHDYHSQSSRVPTATPVATVEHLSVFDKFLLKIPGLAQFVDEHRQVSHATRAADESLSQLQEKETVLLNKRVDLTREYRTALCRKEELEKNIQKMLILRDTGSESFSEAALKAGLLDYKFAIEKEKKTLAEVEQVTKDIAEVEKVRLLIKNCATDSSMVATVMYQFNTRMKGLRLGDIHRRKFKAAEGLIEDAEDMYDDSTGVGQMLESYSSMRNSDMGETSLEDDLMNLELKFVKKAKDSESHRIAKSLPEIIYTTKGESHGKSPSPPPDGPPETDKNMLVVEGEEGDEAIL